MASVIGCLLSRATRDDGEPLNILTCPTHERAESALARTGHRFWAYRSREVKDWNRNYAPVPENYVLLNPAKGDRQIPLEVDFDLVLSQNKFGQISLLSRFARLWQVPLISLEHTLPLPNWDERRLKQLREMRGDINVFISHYSVDKWGWDPLDPSVRVIHHGIDTDAFSPDPTIERKPHILSVVNDWKNRDVFCGYSLWREATGGLPVRPVGDTPGLSRPAASVADLANEYRTAGVFINTSLVSPVPTSLLEAMACGCPVVTTANCMMPEFIEHGKNGLMSNDPRELREFCQLLLSDRELAEELGRNARQTIMERFSMEAFVRAWNGVFEETVSMA